MSRGLTFMIVMGTLYAGAASGQMGVERTSDHTYAITIDGEEFAGYVFNPEFKFPFVYPVNGPISGESVTTWDTPPFPHHSSLWFACDHVNQANYWQALRNVETGQIHVEEVRIEDKGPDRVVLISRHHWAVPGEDPIFRDDRLITFTAPSSELRFIDFEIGLTALTEVRIRRTNHSLFAARMAPDLSVNRGGELINAEGARGADETFAQASNWMAGYGPRAGGMEGLAIFQHPDNPWYPSPWFTRDYGFFSPTPMQWLEGHLIIPEGDTLRFQYRVVVFAGDAAAAGLVELYAEYSAKP